MTQAPIAQPAPEVVTQSQPAVSSLKESRPLKGSVTEHQLRDPSLSYRAQADWMILRKKEKPIAEMFYVHYAATGKAAEDSRPITFVFNGGPGASSAYLHMGALGPQRVMFGKDGSLLPPPARLTENESTWLTFTDLVFIDPVGTGFSRTIDEAAAEGKPAEGGKSAPTDEKENTEFYKIKRDLESLGEFISKFLSKHKLWSRPVFIAGESYGGFRVAKLARQLQEGYGVGLNGAILISPALEFTLLEGSDYDALMWTDSYPSMVAAAHQHGKSTAFKPGADLDAVLNTAETFATRDLVRYLIQGELMPESERAEVLRTMAAQLGLSPEYIERKRGRVAHVDFVRELLREQRKVCGLYDASMTAVDPFPDRDAFQGADPTLFSIERVFTAGINTQLREKLKVETERDYHLLSFQVNTAWQADTRQHALQTQVGATDDLRYAMSLNPHMKVFITHGIYDLVTPYFSANRLVALMKLTPEQRKNLTLEHFKGGHMFYAWEESRQKFKSSMKAFYKSALTGHDVQ